MFHVLASETAPNTTRPVTLDMKTQHWTLGWVCRLWRRVLVTRASFWSTISISANVFGPSAPAKLETILARSMDAPLVVVFHANKARNPLVEQSLIRALTSHSRHWSQITLHAPIDLFLQIPDLGLDPSAVPELRRLCIVKAVADSEPNISESSDIFRGRFDDAPSLQSFSISDYDLLSHLSLPWNQIRRFQAGGSRSAEDELQILSNLPNLVEYNLDNPVIGDIPLKKLRLSHLTRLRIDNNLCLPTTSSFRLLPCLFLPALEEVDVVGCNAALEALVLLVQRSRCWITKLALTHMSTLWGQPEYCTLRALSIISPELTTLRLVDNVFPVDLLRHITVKQGDDADTAVFPHLTGISIRRAIRCLPLSVLESEVLFNLVRSRRDIVGGVANLRRLELVIPIRSRQHYRDHVEPISELQQFRKQGMEILVAFPLSNASLYEYDWQA
ncbi:hypothetical protein C8J56DRAFT_521543 [Mycena floridula]|nr:hypothetical protein C8J56DRAFT_521543 [Mycena floridula]